MYCHRRLPWRAFVLLAWLWVSTLLAGGCAGLLTPADPRPVSEIIAEAEGLIQRKAYQEASELYARVVAREPANPRHALRRGELLEALDQGSQARAVYRAGLEQAPGNAPERKLLTQRLALLSATGLVDIETAEGLLATMPAGSVPQLDLSAFLYIQSSQYEEALNLLNLALPRTTEPDQKALVFYHAALIYHYYHDEKNTFTSLYHAINNATHLGLIRQVEELWTKVSGSEPLPQAEEKRR